LFAKRERTLPPDQFEVRPVQTKRGITMVGLFSAAITRVEREADAPYREAIAAKRLARDDAGRAADGAIDGASQRGLGSFAVQASLNTSRRPQAGRRVPCIARTIQISKHAPMKPAMR
jgi:hypothetical protein